MKRSQIFLLISLSLWVDSAPADRPFELRTTVEYPDISEMSGIVKSRRYDDVYWVHNDSGDRPRLFAIDKNARVVFPDFLRQRFHGEEPEASKIPWPGHEIALADNYDWEDIAIDEEFIYISDLGNNGNARRDMGVYILYEPNPRAVERSRILQFIPVRYPHQTEFPAEVWHLDSEAIFIDRGKLYILSKHRKSGEPMSWEPGVDLYRLDTRHTDRVNVLHKVDSRSDVTLATGADLSPDGRHLAVISYLGLWIFDKPRWGGRWLSKATRKIALDPDTTGQLEAICWEDDETIVFTNEQRQIFEVRLEAIPYIDAKRPAG